MTMCKTWWFFVEFTPGALTICRSSNSLSQLSWHSSKKSSPGGTTIPFVLPSRLLCQQGHLSACFSFASVVTLTQQLLFVLGKGVTMSMGHLDRTALMLKSLPQSYHTWPIAHWWCQSSWTFCFHCYPTKAVPPARDHFFDHTLGVSQYPNQNAEFAGSYSWFWFFRTITAANFSFEWDSFLTPVPCTVSSIECQAPAIQQSPFQYAFDGQA